MNHRNLRKLLWLALTALLLLHAYSSSAMAQTQFATLGGRILDSTGAAVPEAKVTLNDATRNTKRELISGNDGLYVFASVPAGSYSVTVEKDGFKKVSENLSVDVAERRTLDFTLEVGQVTETVTVTESTVEINTTSGDLSRVITPAEVAGLPLITLNPYNLVGLTAGAADMSRANGDSRGSTNGTAGEGGGFAINGARTSSVNTLLDGGDNNNTFITGAGQTVPLDAVQEFRIQSNSMTSEFGRNAVVANVITKSGSNNFHGSAYEYHRDAALTTNTFDNNAKRISKPGYTRNQFGATAGGPIYKDHTFFFASFEGLRVRSSAPVNFFVPTAAFLSNSSTNTRNFIAAFGGAPASTPGTCLTAQQIVETVEGGGAGSYATNPLINPNTATPIAAGTNLFCRDTVLAPVDAGGSGAQNSWLATGKIDHHFSSNTVLTGLYAYARSIFPPGSNSLSPYNGFNTTLANRSHNINLALTHGFGPRIFSESRFVYSRFDQAQPLGSAPSTTPCWNYSKSFNTPTGEQIVFPGYIPNVCQAASIPSGGPQNIYQFSENFTQSKGKNTFKYGGSYLHLRDNHTFGALENAFERTNTIQGFLNGTVDRIQVAIDPKGKVPGDIYDIAVDGPFQFPSFTRHYRYHEFGFYGEDTVKLTRRLSVTAGLRWEYFGVLHSPAAERNLDANLIFGAVGTGTSGGSIYSQIRDARFQRTNNLYQQDWHDFGPRLGFAYDLFGTGRTVLRGGYGIYYDRNFGNALFNVFQNPPNYSVVTLAGAAFAPIMPNQFDTLAAVGAAARIRSSGRALLGNLKTAYSEQYNLTLEHDLFNKGIIASASYVGTRGIHLYSLNNLNPIGSCLRANVNPTCIPDSLSGGAHFSRLNQTGITGVNTRGNAGFSRYNGLSFEVRTRQIAGTGLTLNGNYTWAHAIDNESSFFGDSAFDAAAGTFGFRDPFNPALDKASSSNDIRHRATLSWTWQIPFAKNKQGLVGQVFGGWELNGLYFAQTGGAFSVYDGSNNSTCAGFDGTNYCYPVLTGAVPKMTDVPNGANPNSFVLYDVSASFQNQDAFCAAAASQLACTAQLNNLQPGLLSPRNLLRTPGLWNLDTGILKNFHLPWEGKSLQFRAEFFNLFNHSNLYGSSGTNLFTGSGAAGSGTSIVTAVRGVSNSGLVDRRSIQFALRFKF